MIRPVWIPLKADPPTIKDEFFAEIGRAIVFWAWFENAIFYDLTYLSTVIRKNNLEIKIPLEIPVGFSRRIKLWRRLSLALYANIPRYKEIVKKIHTDAIDAADDRDALIHGMVEGWGQPDDATLNLVHMKAKRSGVEIRKYRINIEDVTAMTAAARNLHDMMMSLTLNRMLGTHRIADDKSQ